MATPVYKVEFWAPGAGSPRHSLTSDINVMYKEAINDNVGNFTVTLPTKKNGSYYYNDIALYDTVKIWLGYDSVSGTQNFTGIVTKISAPLSTPQGYVRTISGLSLGEILLRRLRKDSFWSDTIYNIVNDLRDDLGLGNDIAADSTTITLEIDSITYFDLLRLLSDFWVSVGSQVKKDFYVDESNNLTFKNRPLRSVGVETLGVGSNIINYQVTRDIDQVQNYITVYGAKSLAFPSDFDARTEFSTTGWSCWDASNNGTMASVTNTIGLTGVKVGTRCIEGQIPSSADLALFLKLTFFLLF